MSARSSGPQGLLVFGKHVRHVFKSDAEFVRVDELSDQGDVLAGEPVIQPDEEAV